jgi:ankyrin repeat protein
MHKGSETLALLSTFAELQPLLDEPNPATGFTPLATAAASGSSGCIRFLLDNGANGLYKSEAGASLFHLAAEGGDLTCLWAVSRVLPMGSLNFADAQEWSPLLYASANGHDALSFGTGFCD